MEACGAREVELDSEINSPEVYNDPQLLRQKSDELSDLRFHQEELFAAWEAPWKNRSSTSRRCLKPRNKRPINREEARFMPPAYLQKDTSDRFIWSAVCAGYGIIL